MFVKKQELLLTLPFRAGAAIFNEKGGFDES